MRKFWVVVALVAAACGLTPVVNPSASAQSVSTDRNQQRLEQVFQSRSSDVQVQGQGQVVRLLSDDLNGSRHQRFIVRLPSGRTLLVAHNIDLAPRVASLRVGDAIAFYGEYEWNAQGGVIHWTHHDPAGRHVGGWLQHNGRTYQ